MIRKIVPLALLGLSQTAFLAAKDIPIADQKTIVQKPASSKVTGTEPLPPLPEGAFTFVVVPDTQGYTGKGAKSSPDSDEPVTNLNQTAQIDWILANQKKENIVFVSFVGDIVDRNVPEQWAVAKKNIDRLRGAVPFSLTLGNHDMASSGDAHLFQETFPASSFKDYPWYLGSYTHDREDQNISANNVNSAQEFSAGGINFLHISIECNAPDDVLAWAGKLLESHRDRLAIITTHMDLGIIEKPKTKEGFIIDPKGRMRWSKIHGPLGNNPEQLWDKLYRHHSNLNFILSGDQSRVTARRLDKAADDGHTIHALMSDYMSDTVLRLMRFRPDKGEVEVLSYQVSGDVLVDATIYVPELSQHRFTIPLRVKR